MSRTVVEVATDPPYFVHVGEGVLGEAAAGLDSAQGAVLLADERVIELHAARLGPLADLPRLCLAGGEATKSLEHLGRVLAFMAHAGLSRSGTLVTLGGGVIGDLGGLAASLFKRGTQVVHCPSTLLAQVDASVGGKTAVNLPAGKNLAGTFHQPRAVFADTALLATLPAAERASGLGEVVKTALIGGESDLAAVEAVAAPLARLEPAVTADVVRACVTIKARVVASDPQERGARRALNLGHTFAHAIEHAAGYGVVPHGVAVACGLCLALQASARLGLLSDPALEARVHRLLGSLDLPTSLGELRERHGTELGLEALMAGLAHDKKGRVGAPELVLLRGPGKLELGVLAEETLLRELLSS